MFSGRKVAVWDCEIKTPIEKCSKGWQSHGEMGISVLCLYDYATGRYRVFDDKNCEEAVAILHTYDVVAGFNTVGFDWKLLRATWPCPAERRSVDADVLREIWRGLKLDPDHFEPKTHGGYKLDDVAWETIQMRKSGNGAAAPLLYQEGRLSEVIDYCLEDVRIEKTLFEFACRYGYVVRNGRRLEVALSARGDVRVTDEGGKA